MGFDLHGRSGNYFRANVWTWHALLDLVRETGTLEASEMEAIGRNDGHFIPAEKAGLLAERLERAEPPASHEGAAVPSSAEEVVGILGGRVQPYVVDRAKVNEFIEFCRASGGFEVW